MVFFLLLRVRPLQPVTSFLAVRTVCGRFFFHSAIFSVLQLRIRGRIMSVAKPRAWTTDQDDILLRCQLFSFTELLPFGSVWLGSVRFGFVPILKCHGSYDRAIYGIHDAKSTNQMQRKAYEICVFFQIDFWPWAHQHFCSSFCNRNDTRTSLSKYA